MLAGAAVARAARCMCARASASVDARTVLAVLVQYLGTAVRVSTYTSYSRSHWQLELEARSTKSVLPLARTEQGCLPALICVTDGLMH